MEPTQPETTAQPFVPDWEPGAFGDTDVFPALLAARANAERPDDQSVVYTARPLTEDRLHLR